MGAKSWQLITTNMTDRKPMSKRTDNKRRLVEAAGGRCRDCDGVFPDCCFDFDHRDPNAKAFNIGHTLDRKLLPELQAEAAKCDLVCANCHRVRTSCSPEVRSKMRLSKLGVNGRRHSDETRDKIRIAATGRTPSLETRQKISLALLSRASMRARSADGRFA
jgi:hypothetical protein